MRAATGEVALVVNGLTIGGTEKGLVNHALALDRERFATRVVCARDRGPRGRPLEAAGIPVGYADGDQGRLVELLRGADLVHVWRAGIGEAAVPVAVHEAGVPLAVETNVFGLVDRSRHGRAFDCHLFLSKSCALRYRLKTRMQGPEFHRRHRVLPLPLDAARLRELAPARADAKRLLGLDPARPVVGRIGRADDLKWRNLLVDMLPRLLGLAPEAQVLFVGATEAKRRRLGRSGVLTGCSLHQPVVDERQVATFYAACDIVIAAAELGESQGLAIGEAMALGIPVVTCSTPWVDNAQVEYVDHGRTGYVANHPRPFAEAVAALLADPDLRERFGAAGREKAHRLLDVRPLTERLERLYEALLAGREPPDDWQPNAHEVDAFEHEYTQRLRAEFRPLRPWERVEARLEREHERAVRMRGLMHPRRLRFALALARDKLATRPRVLLRRGRKA